MLVVKSELLRCINKWDAGLEFQCRRKMYNRFLAWQDGVPAARAEPAVDANSRLGNDFQLDEPPFDLPRQVVFGAARSLKAAHVRKVDRAVRLDARGRIQFWMIDDPDGDDVGGRQNAPAGKRSRGPNAC
jgi:hypothetical protein